MTNCSDFELYEVLKKYKVNDNTFKESFLKKLLFQITFLFLPKRVLKIYLALSFLAFISSVKNKPFSIQYLNKEKISYILDITLNDDILIIPTFTFNWTWNKNILEETIIYHDKQFKLKDFILDDRLFVHHTHAIANIFTEKLPKIFKFKLNLKNKRIRTAFEHLLIKNAIHSFKTT